MNKFQSFLAPHIQSYINYQKASQCWNEGSYESNLSIFDHYCHRHYPNANTLSQEMVDTWCKQRETESNNSCRTRIYVVVSFIRYLRERDKTDIREPEIPRKEVSTYIPHAFTQKELENFFYACDNIPNKKNTQEYQLRKITIPVFFRLLYSSGIRTNEARLLRVEDVSLHDGILNIRYSKGHNQHYIVLHDSMLQIMREYDTAIKHQYPNRTYFFPTKGDSFHTNYWVQRNFRQMWDMYNKAYATAYELRHHYATENINQWINEGFGFDEKLLYLSRSMGHSVLESTKYYYSLVPKLVDILKIQTEESFNDIVPEVADEESN